MEPINEHAARIFNDAMTWFQRLPELPNPDLCIDLTITVRHRFFASLDAMWAEWRRQATADNWPLKDITGWLGTALQPMPGREHWEIWAVVKHNGRGQIITPQIVDGHEHAHIYQSHTVNFLDPDALIDPHTYR